MDINLVIALVGVILSALGIPSFIYFVGDRIRYLRRFNYYLKNKKIKVKIDSNKNYASFTPDIGNIKQMIIKTMSESGKQCEYARNGSNYIEILLKESQAPYYLTFDYSYPDECIESETRIEIRIKILGTIIIGYRENKINQEYLLNIEKIYKIIEKEYRLVPLYEDHHLSSSLTDFDENWQNVQRVNQNGAAINIGNNVIDIHSTTLSSVCELIKEHITEIRSKPQNNS